MKNFIINNVMNLIKNKKTDLTETDIEQIRYGLISIYLLVSKLIVIIIVSIILNITKEVLIFITLYNFIRMPSFGLHATKSYICLILSLSVFILIPLISTEIIINNYIKYLVGIIGIIFMYKNAPADTHKRPIINKKRREIYKLLSVTITFLYCYLSLVVPSNYISNLLIFSIILQLIIISPFTYMLFKLSYNNYLNYKG